MTPKVFDFSTLIEILRNLADGPFLCVEFTGNAGDELLREGFYSLVAQERIPIGTPKNSSLIYLHGGGAINSLYTAEPIIALRNALIKYKNVVVGPCSVTPEYDFLKKWIPDTESLTIFTREEISYNILKEVFRKIRVILSHDTALYFYGKSQKLIEKYNLEKKEKHPLLILRSDNEALLKGNDRASTLSLKNWLSLHLNAESIITDRLHSAIAGMIFNIPTQITHNSYHKNFAVWIHSLKSKGVGWFLPKKNRALGFLE